MPPAPAAAPARQRRTDGDSTRTEIIETAGRLFAEHGYHGTTSKAICEAAGVNIAAINYHFGGRDALYVEVLSSVHRQLLSIAELQSLNASTEPPDQKLLRIFESLTEHVQATHSWQLTVWAREVLSPTDAFVQLMKQEAWPKFDLMTRLISEITGFRPDDIRMPQLIASIISPLLVMLFTGHNRYTPLHLLNKRKSKELARDLWQFAMAGLDAARQVNTR